MQGAAEIDELINLVGDAAMVDLCCIFGGTPLYIAQTDTCFERLSIIVGSELARKIINEFPGQTFKIPKAQQKIIINRNQDIGADCAAGMTQRQLAFKYGLTIRRIRDILNSPNPHDRWKSIPHKEQP